MKKRRKKTRKANKCNIGMTELPVHAVRRPVAVKRNLREKRKREESAKKTGSYLVCEPVKLINDKKQRKQKRAKRR